MIPHQIPVSAPQFELLKQTSLCEEVIGKNGNQKILHTVVKNSPFTITFGFTNTNLNDSMNLHKYTVDISLFYDSDSQKEVDFIKTKPLQVKSTISPNGTKITLEARIKVLTSQLEDMLFRIGIRAMDPTSKELVFTAMSDAIKVISKSDQVKKKNNIVTAPKKRKINDSLVDYLEQIEAIQEEHSKLLEKITATNLQLIEETKALPVVVVAQSQPLDFQVAFKDFMQAYNKLGPDVKRQKVSSVLANIQDSSSFAELLDLFWAEGLSREIGMQRSSSTASLKQEIDDGSLCTCTVCPHKKELKRIENFYDDIFSLTG